MPAQRAIWKRLGSAFIGLTLALAGLGPLAGAPQVAHAAGAYVVDATLDAPDTNINDNTCSDGVGDCTLRAAIQEASNDVGPTTITFANDLAGQTFVLTNTYGPLLWIGSNITVTGELKNITISGADLGAGKSNFKIEGDHNLLENLTIKQAPQDGVQMGDLEGVGTGSYNTLNNVTLIQNGASGVYVLGGEGGHDNTIQNSKIGMLNSAACGTGNTTGVYIDQGAMTTTVRVNNIACNAADGVHIANANNVEVAGNNIGISTLVGNGGNGVYALGTTGPRFDGNTISGNALNGILLENSSTAGVYGNFIGTNAAGTAAVPNGNNGIALLGSSDHGVIGGTSPSAGNLISGNALSGILLDGSGAHDNVVLGNKIGTSGSGAGAIPNGQNGVRLQNLANNNTIGGHGNTNVRNLISGNSLDGILLQTGATANYIDGNFIGLAANGLNAIPNELGGVAVIGAPFNGIGGGFASTNQYISGNRWQGIYVGSSNDVTIGASDHIGIAADDATPRGNGLQGIEINSSNNATVMPFAVLYNGGSGIALIGSGSQNDKLAPTYVAFNGGLPIDLGEDGPTANDPGDGDGGPNTLLNYPEITSSSGSVITGTACANCTVLIYNVYGNPAIAFGGGFYIQSATANGAGQWSAALIGGLRRLNVSLVACQSPCGLTGNTSEMSPRPILYMPLMQR